MRYLSFRSATAYESVGAIIDGHIVDLAAMLPDETSGLSPIRRLLLARAGVLPTAPDDVPGLRSFDLEEITVLPLVPDPTKVVAAPVNYLDHKVEMNEDAHIDSLGVFLKAPSSVLAADETVRLPYTDRRFDQEGELAFVVGRTATDVAPQQAGAYIAGYTCLLDMTMRGGEDRSTRKSFDTFTPLGPYLVTPDEVGDVSALRLRTWVNNELRQDADIADLIWGVPELLAYVSSVMTLQAGDVVTTGTPAGIGQVRDGDQVAVEISRIGRLQVAVSAANAVACPTRGAGRGPRPPVEVTPVRER